MTGPVSCALGLRCIDCRREEPLAYRLACPGAGASSSRSTTSSRCAAPARAGPSPGAACWRYHPVLPIRDRAHFVSLGEGGTPLLDAPALARALGVRRLLLKFEGTNRRAPSRTARRPRPSPPPSSSGTAPSPWSRPGTRVLAGRRREPGRPQGAHLLLRAGRRPEARQPGPGGLRPGPLSGFYDDLIRLWDRMLAEQPVFDGGASRNVYKQEGKKTLALGDRRGLRLPAAGRRRLSGGRRGGVHLRPARVQRDARARLDPGPSAPGGRAIGPGKSHRHGVAGRRGSPAVPLTYTVAEGLRSETRREGRVGAAPPAGGQGLATDVGDEAVLDAQRLLARTEGLTRGRPGSRRSPPRAGSWPRAPSTRPARSAA